MRQLRYVGPGPDRDHLVLETGDGEEQFVLFIDGAMRDAVRADLPRLHPDPDLPPPITPREIQMRIRAGATAQDLAEASEMPLERVLRFAGPVLEERQRIAQEARRGKARRSTADAVTVVFGDAVDTRFAAHGIEPTDVSWDSRRRPDGQWVITAQWIGGESQRSAEWAFQLATRSVSPLDDTAADLLSDRPIRPVIAAPEEPVRPSLAAAPPLAPGVVAFPVLDGRTDQLPTLNEDVFDQDSLDEDPRHVPGGAARPAQRPAPASAATAPLAAVPPAPAQADPAVPAAAAAEDNTNGYQAPPLPLRLAEPPATPAPAAVPPAAPAAKVTNLGVAHKDDDEEDRAARSRIPSWDDILLGVRRKQD